MIFFIMYWQVSFKTNLPYSYRHSFKTKSTNNSKASESNRIPPQIKCVGKLKQNDSLDFLCQPCISLTHTQLKVKL